MGLVESLTGFRTFRAETSVYKVLKEPLRVNVQGYDLRGKKEISDSEWRHFKTLEQAKSDLLDSQVGAAVTGYTLAFFGAVMAGTGLAEIVNKDLNSVTVAPLFIPMGMLFVRVGIAAINDSIKARLGRESLNKIDWF